MKKFFLNLQIVFYFSGNIFPQSENNPKPDSCFQYYFYEPFPLEVGLSTNYYSNLLHFGIQWNSNISDFTIGIGNHLDGFAGFILSESEYSFIEYLFLI